MLYIALLKTTPRLSFYEYLVAYSMTKSFVSLLLYSSMILIRITSRTFQLCDAWGPSPDQLKCCLWGKDLRIGIFKAFCVIPVDNLIEKH